MAAFARQEILDSLRAKVAAGEVILGGGAGTGLSAKLEEAGGIDLIVIYNSGRFRMAGRGSLAGLMPYGDANAIVMEMAGEVLPAAQNTPVLAGVCGTDPFRLMPVFLQQVRAAGFSGVQNFPTVGLFDGTIRTGLEETGMGYGLEVDMIGLAHEMDLLTTPYLVAPLLILVVVFGGVGNLWGTLVAGLSLGIANKFLKPFTGAVLAKIFVLVFIILFIQRRPRGLFPQRGRAAEV